MSAYGGPNPASTPLTEAQISGAGDNRYPAANAANSFNGSQRAQLRANVGAAYSDLDNVSFAVSASAGALTIALKDINGNDPTSTTPIILGFRNSSLAASPNTPVVLEVTSAASITIPSTSTCGFASSQAGRLWVTGWDDTGGTFRLGVFNALNSSTFQIYPLNESGVGSSLQVVAAGNSAGQHYTSGAAVTSKAYRILGYVEWGPSGMTAGTWTTTNLSNIVTFGPGIKKPGDSVQVVPVNSATQGTFTGTSALGVVSTGITAPITPNSAANPIRVSTKGSGGNSSLNVSTYLQLSRGSTLIGQPIVIVSSGNNFPCAVAIEVFDLPNTVSGTTYQLQGKVGSASTGAYPLGALGGVSPAGGAYLEAVELMG